jgi:hypothetical protein
VSWHLTSVERRRCPELYQEQLTRAGGLNRNREPNFKFAWGQTETFRAGGTWAGDDFPSYTGYRDLLLGMGDPSWMILQWHRPEEYGTPESYYVNNHDDQSGLQTMGEYPYRGRYEILFNLIHREMANGALKIYRMELNPMLIDRIIPLVVSAKEISIEKDMAARIANREREEQESENKIEAIVKNAHPAFDGGKISFARQGVRNSLIDKKMLELARSWSQTMGGMKKSGTGMIQGGSF